MIKFPEPAGLMDCGQGFVEVWTRSQIYSIVETYKKDAERYRYLRNRRPADVLKSSGPTAGVWIDTESEDEDLVLLTGEDADKAIDEILDPPVSVTEMTIEDWDRETQPGGFNGNL